MRDKNKQQKSTFTRNWEGGDSAEHTPIQARPLEVKVYNSFDKALKAFRALVQKEKVLSTYKEKQRYEKPSDKKRRKRNERKRKLMELEMKSGRNHNRNKKIKEVWEGGDSDD